MEKMLIKKSVFIHLWKW